MGDVFVRIMTVGFFIIGKNYATPNQMLKKDTNRRDNLKNGEMSLRYVLSVKHIL